MTRIAIFGGSFNPPGIHDRQVVLALAEQFDRVVVVPCGPRPDKPETNYIDPIHRAVMCDMTFGGIPNVEVDLSDLELDIFTRTHHLNERYRGHGDVWHVVGQDIVKGGASGESFIHKRWMNPEDVWYSLQYAVFTRKDHGELDHNDLPPQSALIDCKVDGWSPTIRENIFFGRNYQLQLLPRVTAYISRYALYTSRRQKRRTDLDLGVIRPYIVPHEENARAMEIVGQLSAIAEPDIRKANLIVPIGGDGMMLHTIRSMWQHRIPFFGINAGHRGFLLNEVDGQWPGLLFQEELIVRRLPLLYVEVVRHDGTTHSSLAFNDAWVERATGQTAHVRIGRNGHVLHDRVHGDIVLVATPAGSTAYARVMGAAHMDIDVEGLVLAGSNIGFPKAWQHTTREIRTTFDFTALDTSKRPIRGYVDGVDQGLVRSMKVRVSRIASAELACTPQNDIPDKAHRLINE